MNLLKTMIYYCYIVEMGSVGMNELSNVFFKLRDYNEELTDAWTNVFREYANFDIRTGDILQSGDASAIVSPANSFGVMDGGVDLAYTRYFGADLSWRLQQKIKAEYFGELPVGQATIIPTENDGIKFLISAPTMRVPQIVRGTVNAYVAFRAVLIEIIKFNQENPKTPITTVLCPGLATATGELPANLCALQMLKAYENINNPKPLAWDELLFSHYNMMGK